jgi:hypothetical protein
LRRALLEATISPRTTKLATALRPASKRILHVLLVKSLLRAIKEQGLDRLFLRLSSLVEDISAQYSGFELDTPYLRNSVRGLHAFQIRLATGVIKEMERATVIDIGDSAGTHLQYLLGIFGSDKRLTCLSVNSDPAAVEKIRAKGLDALLARAEEIDDYGREADVVLCFETLEHLTDPARFLYGLSSGTHASHLVVTVPYVRRSRVGLSHIRRGRPERVDAENTHLFELNPEDWKLLVRHAGWNVAKEEVYLQYPRWGLFRFTKPLWSRLDFEGFYGMILTRDHTWSARYADW